jgi:Fumarylacetoacetate (FAA) hydrolase family
VSQNRSRGGSQAIARRCLLRRRSRLLAADGCSFAAHWAASAEVNRAVEFCSQFFTLFPGDVISMGSGPGNAFIWKKYLQVGDQVKATIEGLGVQEYSIAAEA